MKNSGGSKGGGQPDNPNLQSDRMWAGGNNSFNEAAPDGGGMMQPQMGQQSDMMQRDPGWGQGGGGWQQSGGGAMGGMGGKGDGGMGGMDPAQPGGGQGHFGGKDGGQPPGMGMRKIGYQGPQQAQMGMMGRDSGFSDPSMRPGGGTKIGQPDPYNAPNPQGVMQAGSAGNWGQAGQNPAALAALRNVAYGGSAGAVTDAFGGDQQAANSFINANTMGGGGGRADPNDYQKYAPQDYGIGTMLPGIRSQYEAAGKIKDGKWVR